MDGRYRRFTIDEAIHQQIRDARKLESPQRMPFPYPGIEKYHGNPFLPAGPRVLAYLKGRKDVVCRSVVLE